MRTSRPLRPLVLAAGFLAAAAPLAAQEAAQVPAGAEAQKIVVESVSGRVRYARTDRFFALTAESQLTQGDKIVGDTGSICKLEFQHPRSGAVLAAAILRGYTEMTVAEAYQQGEASRTQLDVTQGVVRAGVVRTAVPPSFRVRTPRVVVGVRGTEIRELEVSNDYGDALRMGRVGIAMTHDAVPLFRSQRAEQGTLKRTEPDRRGSELLRAIEFANLTHRVFLSGPHRGGLEVDFDRGSVDVVEFNPGEFYKGEGNAMHDRDVNSSLPIDINRCPTCDKLTFGKGNFPGTGLGNGRGK